MFSGGFRFVSGMVLLLLLFAVSLLVVLLLSLSPWLLQSSIVAVSAVAICESAVRLVSRPVLDCCHHCQD